MRLSVVKTEFVSKSSQPPVNLPRRRIRSARRRRAQKKCPRNVEGRHERVIRPDRFKNAAERPVKHGMKIELQQTAGPRLRDEEAARSQTGNQDAVKFLRIELIGGPALQRRRKV